jgi:ParB family chromosome partitioning protein
MARDIEYIDPNDLVIVGLDTDDRQEHALFDERAFYDLDTNLVANILVYGIQLPVLIRKEAGQLYVVDGRQRVKAARAAAARSESAGEYAVKVPCRETVGDDKRMGGIMVSTNELRQSDTALERAFKATRLLDLLGDEAEVCIAFGRSKTTIRNWLSLASADSKIHAAVKAGTLSTQGAVELSKLPREQQVEQLEAMQKGMTAGRITEAMAKEARQNATDSSASNPNNASAEPKDPIQRDIETGGASTPSERSGRRAVQAGIKRIWLRKALNTQAAEDLSDEQRGVLRWFAFGETEKGAWYEDFVWNAEAEMAK